MAKQIEAAGIPVAYITTLDALARSVGAPRIIRGRAIVNVVGDPSLPPEAERRFRKDLLAKALQALQTPVADPTILA
jgi:glycine reductase complex component B subunit gamma